MLEVIILAAGRGSRMHSSLPKVLHTLAGEPLLAHVLATAHGISASRTHVVIGHGADAVRHAVGGGGVHFHHQTEQLGTGHAVQQALPHCDPNSMVLVLYGDVPLLRPETLTAMLDTVSGQPVMLSTALDDPQGYGRVLRDAQGSFAGVVEHKDATAEQRRINEVNTGVLAARAADLSDWLGEVTNDNAQREYYLPDALKVAVNRGQQVSVYQAQHSIETLGVNDRVQLQTMERALQRRRAESLMRDGVTLADAGRIDIRGKLVCGSDVTIDANVVFEGDVTLGDGVHIGPNCVLRHSTIASDTRIEAFSWLEEARVGAGCTVGPYARLRPGTELASGAKIGNFVETKNARIGAGSKANHLAYIGDATVGAGSNIGAGTITCNYDGAHKHRTELGNNVFVGSNSTLVAPLSIDDGGFVAAGSTVTKPIGSEQLAVARARQRNIDGWQRPSKDNPSSDNPSNDNPTKNKES